MNSVGKKQTEKRAVQKGSQSDDFHW